MHLLTDLQGNYDEAEAFFVRAIAIGEKALGPEHPALAVYLNNRAVLLYEQVRAVRIAPNVLRRQEAGVGVHQTGRCVERAIADRRMYLGQPFLDTRGNEGGFQYCSGGRQSLLNNRDLVLPPRCYYTFGCRALD